MSARVYVSSFDKSGRALYVVICEEHSMRMEIRKPDDYMNAQGLEFEHNSTYEHKEES